MPNIVLCRIPPEKIEAIERKVVKVVKKLGLEEETEVVKSNMSSSLAGGVGKSIPCVLILSADHREVDHLIEEFRKVKLGLHVDVYFWSRSITVPGMA